MEETKSKQTETKASQHMVESAELEELQAKLEAANQKIKDMETQEYETKLLKFVRSLNPSSPIYEEYITRLFKESGLKFDGNELVGSEEIISEIKEKDERAFAPDRNERVSAPTSGRATKLYKNDSAFERGFNASTGFPSGDEPSDNKVY